MSVLPENLETQMALIERSLNMELDALERVGDYNLQQLGLGQQILTGQQVAALLTANFQV